MKALAVGLLLVAAPAAAQDVKYSFYDTRACVDNADDWQAKRACIGSSANACMEDTPGGYSTAGESACLGNELDDWDALLNEIYGPLMKRMKADDSYDSDHVPLKRADALRDMQRAWITYRDASCAFERAQWGGGTGGGPATLSCLMYETAEQVLRLQSNLGDN